jgi:SAM-dependent methyltransferase
MTGAQPLLQKGALRLVRCTDCSMVFASPVSASYLDGSYYEDIGRPFYLSPAKLAGDFAPVRFARELKYFRRFCPSGRALDVGCSTGAFLHALRTRWPDAYEVCGTDVSGPGLRHAASLGIPVRDGDFLKQRTEPAFDAITLWATLEHVANPKGFVAQSAAMLRPGGHCFILVPNFRSLATRLLRERYRYILGQHINYFTHRTLTLLAPPALKEVYYISTHFNPLVIAQDFRRRTDPEASERTGLLVKTNAMKTNRWLGPLRWVYSAAERALQQGDLADNSLIVFRKR